MIVSSYVDLSVFLFVCEKVLAFVEALKQRKITVSVRQTRGMDANAACGQLRNDFQKTPLESVA